MGVIGPAKATENGMRSRQANKYSDPEKQIIPIKKHQAARTNQICSTCPFINMATPSMAKVWIK